MAGDTPWALCLCVLGATGITLAVLGATGITLGDTGITLGVLGVTGFTPYPQLSHPSWMGATSVFIP